MFCYYNNFIIHFNVSKNKSPLLVIFNIILNLFAYLLYLIHFRMHLSLRIRNSCVLLIENGLIYENIHGRIHIFSLLNIPIFKKETKDFLYVLQ